MQEPAFPHPVARSIASLCVGGVGSTRYGIRCCCFAASVVHREILGWDTCNVAAARVKLP